MCPSKYKSVIKMLGHGTSSIIHAIISLYYFDVNVLVVVSVSLAFLKLTVYVWKHTKILLST